MARSWESLSESYRGRLERGGISRSDYESGVSLAAARGHAATPEHIGRGTERPEYERYYERRSELERHWRDLKQAKYGERARYNPEGVDSLTSTKKTRELENAWDYDDLDDYIEDYPDDDDADKYH